MCIKRVSGKLLKQFKSTIKLSKKQREVLVGLILGDAHLETQDSGATYRLVYSQGGEKHQDYLFHVYDIFKSWCLNTPSLRKTDPNFTRQAQWRFSTVSFRGLRFYGKLFYKVRESSALTAQNRKVIPRQISKFLTARSLAYSYMDDGSIKSKQSKGVLFNTHSFTLSEIELLCEELLVKFDLRATVRPQKTKTQGLMRYQIYISGKSYSRLRELILPYLIPEMMYKLPSPRVKRVKDKEMRINASSPPL